MRPSPLLLALLAALGCSGSKPDPVDDTDTVVDTTDTTDTTVDTTDTTDTTDTPVAEVCPGSTAILTAGGAATGFERCADGTVHRPQILPVDPTIGEEACRGTEANLGCTADTDCLGAHTKCVHFEATSPWDTGPVGGSCGCVTSCASDADCGTTACVPPEVHGVSQHAQCAARSNCTADEACGTGECGYLSYDDGCGPYPTMTCRTKDDACRLDADCSTEGQQCAPPVGDEGWTCTFTGCAIGRPLRIDGRPCLPSVPHQDDLARDAWAAIGAAEHASVAAFARFVLQLQALGAPSELVSEAVVAMADEIDHAAFAFRLAGVQPGPMDLAGMTLVTDPRDVLTELVIEACVGETLGAAEAALGATTARPDIAAQLRKVASDETRHAALGWKTVRWILADRPELLGHVYQSLDRAVAELTPSPLPDLPAWGVVGGARQRALAQQTVREVIRPLLDALTTPARLAA